MATSPLYSWPEPDNTDLVKNGALAIRTLGNAIDTTMGTMVAKTVVDAKGDLIAGTAADTVNRLAVGNNGETLVADSSTATGLRYTAGTVQANPVINSAMQVWQRGTSFSIAASTATTYIADRWQTSTGTNQAITVSRQVTNDTTNLPNIQYCLRYQRNSGQTGTGGLYTFNVFESVNSIPYAGKTFTYSFYARAGANYSASSSQLNTFINTGTGTDQSAFAFTNPVSVGSVNSTLTTTWQRFTATGTIPTNATQMSFVVVFTPTGTASTNDYYEITGVQIDIGSVALPFRTYAGTIQGELAACQRYYVRQEYGGSNANYYATGIGVSTTRSFHYIAAPVSMRTSPSLAYGGTPAVSDTATSTSVTNILFYASTTGNQQFTIDARTASGLTQFRPYFLLLGGNGQLIELSAEL
jgi:hypothetical protein